MLFTKYLTLCCNINLRATSPVEQLILGIRHSSNWSLSVIILLLNVLGLVTDLPYSNNGVSDKDKKDDEGFHEGGDGLFTFLKPRQHLRSEHKEEISVGVSTQVETTVNVGQTLRHNVQICPNLYIMYFKWTITSV